MPPNAGFGAQFQCTTRNRPLIVGGAIKSRFMGIFGFAREAGTGNELPTLFVSYQLYYVVTDFITIPQLSTSSLNGLSFFTLVYYRFVMS